jgi:menaquinone-dependent protoporphyrinogen oxidase
MSETKLNALIAYGTYFGATAGTAEEIAKVLREAGSDVKVADLKKEKIQDISQYNLVVLGSGMRMGNWTGEAEDFLKKFQGDLESKKLALFISSLKPVEEKAGKTGQWERSRKVGLESKILKYHLNPMSTGQFGGIVDYNQMGFIIRKSMEIGYKSLLQKYGFKETAPGVYDLRDWDEIRLWAKELAQKASE